MKKFLAVTLSVFVLAMCSFVRAAVTTDEPKISATSAILVEASTGRIIYEKNANERREPASMTKMLTCILALEKLNPHEEIKISKSAVETEDVYLNWADRDSLSALDVINAVMIVSENGGAVALAQTMAGSVNSFAEMMNDKAKEIGCTNSHFVTPNGLPAPNHYSTAADMAVIAVYCMKNPTFRQIAETKHTSIHWIHPKDKWAELDNTNTLLGKYNGANGIKTGWTNAAGGCVAASAKRGDVELIAIVMHSTDGQTRFDDAKKLLDYGFERIRMVDAINKESSKRTLFVSGGKKATVHVGIDENFKFPLVANEDPNLLKVSYEIPKVVDADGGIDEGKVLGEAVLRYNGKPVARVPIVARENISAGFSFSSFFVGLIAPFI